MNAARVSVIGDFAQVDDSEKQEVAVIYLAANPESSQWVGFGDFGFYRMTVKEVYIVGGFGSMGWVTADEYASA